MAWRFYDSSGRVKQNTNPTISLVTALPSSPQDGDECILTDSLTAGTYQWHLRYVSARASNKWVYVGGTPGFAEVTTDQSTSSTAYAALATAGPSFTLPVAGDYLIAIGHRCYASGGDGTMYHSFDIGGTGASDADAIEGYITNTARPAPYLHRSRELKKTGLTAVALVSKYRTSAFTANFAYRWIRVIPIALGG